VNGTFPVVDAATLPDAVRELLLPGEGIFDPHPLPRYFYEIDSWETAKKTKLTAHFVLAELMSVDCREAPRLLHDFPHYVPCAISVLARYLEEFRTRVEAPVFVSVNGGYRSPSHQLSTKPSPHVWGAAANIYRIGDTFLDDERTIEKYARIAEGIGQEVFLRPFGHGPRQADDHLHLDLGFLQLVPHQPPSADA
jgi:hypothetical protein